PYEFQDLDVPIALRIGTRPCTIHPISNFVSYHRLSSFRSFDSNLSKANIPKYIREALVAPECKKDDGKVSIHIVYVDDIILTGDDLVEQKKSKTSPTKKFGIKDLGSLKYFLGMKAARMEGI
ncbi:unnamed protein product, partial [Musa acuminata var. zebrina]